MEKDERSERLARKRAELDRLERELADAQRIALHDAAVMDVIKKVDPRITQVTAAGLAQGHGNGRSETFMVKVLTW